MSVKGTSSTTRIKDNERIKIIAEYIKTKQQPDGYNIRETKNGLYRVSRTKSEHDILEQKRTRLLKQLEEIERKIAQLDVIKDDTAQQSKSERTNVTPNETVVDEA